MELLKWVQSNYENVLLVIAGLVGVAEVVVRITPTQKDDSAVERIGGVLRKVMDFLKVPNNKK